MSLEDTMGFGANAGSYEDALALVEGSPTVRRGDIEVNWTTIRLFCMAVKDSNPSYWDPEFAAHEWGGIVAPPAMLMVWVARLPWAPDRTIDPPASLSLPLPGTAIVNISNVAEYFLPLQLGDRVTAHDVIESISPLKKTAVGPGHFVTTRSTYLRQDDQVVAIERNTLLRYTPTEETC